MALKANVAICWWHFFIFRSSDVNTSASDINNDLKLISDWAFQWKRCFNPDRSTLAQEIIFNRKKVKSSHPIVYFSNIPLSSTSAHKHLGMLLNNKLIEDHLKFVLNKVKPTSQISANSPETVFNYSLKIVHSASFRLWRYCLWSSL